MSLVAHLTALDTTALTAVLQRRPDVLFEPVPGDVDELADRLNGVDSLSKALVLLNRDEVAVTRTIAFIGPTTVAALASTMRADATAVEPVVAGLVDRALLWRAGDQFGLPDRLAAHFASELDAFRPIALIAKQARVADLQAAVAALGGDPSGTKPQLTARLTMLVTDREAISAAVARLGAGARSRLDRLLHGSGDFFFGDQRGPDRALVAAGLMVGGAYGQAEVPRELVATVLLDGGSTVTGRPRLRASTDPEQDGRAGAEAAVLAVTALLDEATAAPLAALKKGGIGARERKRLTTRAGVAEPALAIDVADRLGLLVHTTAGYVASAQFAAWRDEPVATRWAAIAQAWLALDGSPTSRETDDGEIAPPIPMASAGGMIRRALLRAATGGHSWRAVAAAVDWLCPLHGYDGEGRNREVAAARWEAELLGVVGGDRLTTLGERLLARNDSPAGDDAELAGDAAALLPETRGLLVLQSDLTAVVSGQASASAARVLSAAATPEGRGAAVTWRFSPTSVRLALDAGWTADELRAELVAVSNRLLPQPLDYLIGDVARRHGRVRVRETRCCLTGPEAEMTEILHTRGLAKLELRRLAPTVLTSPAAPDAVLAAVRKAGFAPVPEDSDGAVVVAARAKPQERSGPRHPARPRVPAALLADRLLGGRPAAPVSDQREQLAALAPGLDSAEIALLADALDHGRDVRIRYRNRDGNHSVRDIAPRTFWDRWITAYCYLRSDDRDFTVRGIEAVGPVG